MTACLLALSAAPPKLAVLQVAPGEGVPPSTAAAVTESLVAEVRRRSGAEVITQREIASIPSPAGAPAAATSASPSGGVAGAGPAEAAPVPAGAAPVASGAGAPPASAWADDREDLPRAVKDRLYVLTDDRGLYVALAPFQGETPLYAGDAREMSRQRVVGGGQRGRLPVDRVFWEPRVRSGAESLLAMQGAKATLTRGARTIRDSAPFIHGQTGPYAGTRLGTPCDGRF